MIEEGLVRRMEAMPYRARLGDIMSAPLVALPESATLGDAARLMADRSVSSVVLHAGDPAKPAGIITEHDLTRLVANGGAAALERRARDVMSGPVHTVAADDLAYVAIGRMARLGVRHLLVVDGTKGAVGIVTARGLLEARAGPALPLGDHVAAASSAAALAEIQRRLPAIAARLLDDGLGARDISRVISAVLRDSTARAADLARQDLEREGTAPGGGRWSLLVLGSGGRGESLLAPDQDNAIVYDGSGDGPFLAALGTKLADILDLAGIPYCKGGVMAREAAWRRELGEWREEIAGWIRRKDGAELLNVDIFYDFRCVAGDDALAGQLREEALAAAARSPSFLWLLGTQVERMRPPLGLFGGAFGTFRLHEGRIDLKKGGLMAIVCGVRALSLRHGIAETSTAERLASLARRGALNRDDADRLAETHETLMRFILDQQIADIDAGLAPSNRVDPRRLTRAGRRRLRDALREVDVIHDTVRTGLSAGA